MKAYDMTRRPTILYALFVATLSTFALTASYSKGTDFISGTVMISTVFNTVASNGAVTSTLLFVSLFALALCCMALGRTASVRIRWWSSAFAVLASLTLTVPPFIPEGQTALFTVVHTLPVLQSSDKTKWYWLFMAVRFVGYAILVELLFRTLFSIAVPKYDWSTREMFDWSGHQSIMARLRHELQVRVWSHCSFCKRLFTTFSVKTVAVVGSIIAACWIPWMILLYPANIAADTVAQLVWARGSFEAWDPSSWEDIPWARMSDQHPWLDTLIYGWFDHLGFMMGNEAYGLYVLAVLQCILCAGSLALLLCYAGGRLHVPWKLCLVGLGWYALVPIFGRLSMSVVKDSTFLPFFFVWVTIFMEYVRRIRRNERLGVWIPTLLVFLSVLCGLTKKTGLYVTLLTMVIIAIVLRRRLVSCLCIILSLAIFSGISAAAFPALRIAPAGKQEVLAIPLQQTANAVLVHGSDMSLQGKKAINRVLICDTSQIRTFLSLQSADSIKDHCFNRQATNADVSRFLLMWVKQGILHPRTYLNATPWLRNPFTMGAIYDEGFYVHWGWADKGGLSILPQYPENQRSRPQQYGSVLYYAIAKSPVFGLLMSENLYVVWIPLIGIALCILRRRSGNLLYAVPLILSIPMLLLSPAYQTRYSWSLAYGFFVFLMIPWIHGQTEQS
jgi:hypothetical protein